jgi:hypothetical protein
MKDVTVPPRPICHQNDKAKKVSEISRRAEPELAKRLSPPQKPEVGHYWPV